LKARIDRAHEEADRAAGRNITCPVLLLVSVDDDLDIHGDPETIWRPWTAGDLRSRLFHSGHHQAEEAEAGGESVSAGGRGVAAVCSRVR